MQKLEDRPPYVAFEIRSEEDREATQKAGHYVGVDVTYALITPMGSKDRIERKVDEWFEKLEGDVASGRMPVEWFRHFKELYRAFNDGVEAPVNGTSIKMWPSIGPSQLKTLLDIGIRSVEDLAAANESTINAIGMGGRALKQRAADWLASAGSSGKLLEEITSLRAANENLTVRNASLEQQLRDTAAELEALKSGKRQAL